MNKKRVLSPCFEVCTFPPVEKFKGSDSDVLRNDGFSPFSPPTLRNHRWLSLGDQRGSTLYFFATGANPSISHTAFDPHLWDEISRQLLNHPSPNKTELTCYWNLPMDTYGIYGIKTIKTHRPISWLPFASGTCLPATLGLQEVQPRRIHEVEIFMPRIQIWRYGNGVRHNQRVTWYTRYFLWLLWVRQEPWFLLIMQLIIIGIISHPEIPEFLPVHADAFDASGLFIVDIMI